MNQSTLKLGKFSLGMGDRFAQQAEAQLRACVMAAELGAHVVPVWNKSNREHLIIGSEPASVRTAAAAAVEKLDWKSAWHIDADHIRLETVDRFMAASDFFTIDVADSIGKAARAADVKRFADRHAELIGHVEIPGIVAGCSNHARRSGAHGQQVSARGAGSRRNLSPHRAGKGRRPIHHRSFDGRNRLAADAASSC